MAKTAVFAVAVKYGWQDAQRFLGSLRRTGYRDAVYLIVGRFGEQPQATQVMERYGALSDGAVGLIRMVCGAGEREPSETEYSPTAPSRVTHAMQVVVFAGVMADAAMLAEALELDVWCRACVNDGE